MSIDQISHRYAKSLYALALDQGSVEEVYGALQALGKIITQNTDFRDFLSNPLLKENDRAHVLRAVFSGKLPALVEQFLFFINCKARLNMLAHMITSFDALYLTAHNSVRAEIQIALPLEMSVREKILEQLSKKYHKQVLAQWHIRKEILGGFRILIEGRLHDYSFTNQLEQYRNQVLR